MKRHAAALAVLVLVGCQCGTDEPPPDDDLDGNVVIGMGDPDGGPRDGGPPRDAGDLPRDGGGGTEDGGFDDDAGVDDAGTPDAGDRCLEPSETVLTSEEAVSDIATWDGHLVTVVGTATRTPYACTDLPCPKEDPCCNECTATILIDGLIEIADDACFGRETGCAGTECAQVCVPAVIGVDERFRGVLVDGAPIRLDLIEVLP